MDKRFEILADIQKTIEPLIELQTTAVCKSCLSRRNTHLQEWESDRDIMPFWTSKFGGVPYVPKDLEYPRSKSGEPLQLLAQINFEEMPKLDPFPKDGILQFFIDLNDWSDFYIRYISQRGTRDDQQTLGFLKNQNLKYFPVDVPHKIKGKITKHPIPTFADSFEDVFRKYVGNDDYADQSPLYDFYYDLIKDYPLLHMGGYPYECQGGLCLDMNEYVLLLAICTHNEIYVGDAGSANFFITKEDLAKKDFSDVIFHAECT